MDIEHIIKMNNPNLNKRQEIDLYLDNKGIKLSQEVSSILDNLKNITSINYTASNNFIEINACEGECKLYLKIYDDGDYIYLGEGMTF